MAITHSAAAAAAHPLVPIRPCNHTELLLILIGGLFVIEAGSIIFQRAYFKATHGKRIFPMTPIRHSFELIGWGEVTIVVRFWIIAGVLLIAVGIGTFYFEWLS